MLDMGMDGSQICSVWGTEEAAEKELAICEIEDPSHEYYYRHIQKEEVL